MTTDNTIRQMELQVHLAEFSALRDEILALIKWRDGLVFVSLAISGALFSFVFSSSTTNNAGISASASALYLIAPLSSLVGGLWMVNTWRIYRIGNYIRDVLATRINNLLNTTAGFSQTTSKIEVFEWQTSKQRLDFKWQRRVVEWFVYVMTFVVSGMLAQILILTSSKGPLHTQFKSLQFSWVFILNTCLIVIIFILFVLYLKKGRGQESKTKIERISLV